MAKTALDNTPKSEDSPVTPSQDNLIRMEEGAASRGLPQELNQRINFIDAELDELRQALAEANKGVKRGLARMADKEQTLTSKVGETYQRLGELDDAYRLLADKSAHIGGEIKALSKNIVQITEKSELDIGLLTENYAALISRTDELWKKSRQTTQRINDSIKQNAKALGDFEQQLLTEIDSLAKATKERDDSLNDRTLELGGQLTRVELEVRSAQASLLKMQAVDQALERRAQDLETTTGELTNKSRELARATTMLNQRTSQLGEALAVLQAKSEEQSGQIIALQGRAGQTEQALASQVALERGHFRSLGTLLGMLVLAILIILGYEQAKWERQDQADAGMRGGLAELSGEARGTEQRLAGLDRRVAGQERNVQDQIGDIDAKLVAIGDQVDSLDGRLANLRPGRGFGKGNLIHGPEWLAGQPAGRFVIAVARVGDQQALYRFAERHGHYLRGAELAYLQVSSRQGRDLVLVYGNFATKAEADAALGLLPPALAGRHPAVLSMAEVQRHLAK